MRTYQYYTIPRPQDTAEPKPTAEPEFGAVPENYFTRAAYEWNNALQIAAEKMWRR